MLTKILVQLRPTTTEAANWLFFLLLIGGVFLAFLIAFVVLNWFSDRVTRGLTELEPRVDDISERRRHKAELFAETRRRQLEAASGVRR